jgi:hypothetical protein
MITKIQSGLNFGAQYLASTINATIRPASFSDIMAFSFFIGYPRSGHSLVGSLLDAHHNVIIAHELDAVRYIRLGFSREQLFHLILNNSKQFTGSGRKWMGYSYFVPNQWHGRFDKLKIIGDKKGGESSRYLYKDPQLLTRIRNTVKVPLKVFHVVRNPFDSITTMFKRGNQPTLEDAFTDYFQRASAVQQTQKVLRHDELLSIRHEELIAQPRQSIEAMCHFLGIDAPDDFVKDCCSIVFTSPQKSRSSVSWPHALIQKVYAEMSHYDFFYGYQFD